MYLPSSAVTPHADDRGARSLTQPPDLHPACLSYMQLAEMIGLQTGNKRLCVSVNVQLAPPHSVGSHGWRRNGVKPCN